MSLSRAIPRLLALLRRRKLERELEDEIRAHFELAEMDARAAGLTAEDARYAARRSFGAIEPMKEEHRDSRGVRWLETLLRDFRFGLASLGRDPAFAVVAIGVLALGIGANTAMFSLLDAVLLKPLPFPEPDRIVRIWEAPTPAQRNVVNTLDFVDWKRLNTVFDALSAQSGITVSLSGDGEVLRLRGDLVSADYFRVFGVNARLGRTFTLRDEQPGANRVVVLSSAAWQSLFGGDPGILNRTLVLDGEPHRVIGVLAPGPFDRDTAAFWKPLMFTPEQRTRSSHWLRVYGRLRPGATLEQARQVMAAIDARLTDLSPPWKRSWGVAVDPFDPRIVGERLRQAIYIAFGAVILVLLIACANVANLLLARGAARRREMAVRSALGASRGRLVSQLLAETLALCLAGGAAGIAVALMLIPAAVKLLGPSLPFTAHVTLDLRVLAFAGGAALAVTLLTGVLPALRTSFSEPARAMNAAARGSSRPHERLRRAIVAGEVAVSVVLISGALLLFRSLLNLQAVDTGVRTADVITGVVALPEATYPTAEKAALFYRSLAERVNAVPGVEQAAVSTDLPLQRVGEGEAMISMSYDKSVDVGYKRVSPEYFAALGIPILAGRPITPQDRAGAPAVAVVNQALAARLRGALGFADPVGHSVRISTPEYERLDGRLVETEIVGVIRSERVSAPGAPENPVVYVPVAQVPPKGARIIVSTRVEPYAVLPAIRRAVSEADPHIALGDIQTLQNVWERSLSGTSQPASLIGAFALVAVLLAALGLYGVLAHSVIEQRREIGIRLAMGAAPRRVVSRVLLNALSMMAVGLALGVAGSLALTRVLAALLFRVTARDALSLSAACAAAAVVGLAAGFIPARRAARLDPVEVLREDG